MTPLAHTFDVFDTCLVRDWARPVDILEAAARRAAPDASDTLISEAVRRRQHAEPAAAARAGREAVTLDAIYAELDDLAALGVDPAALKAAELKVEREALRPVRAGAERVAAARAAGRRVIFVSDMFLPAAEIRAGLERFGIARPEDPLYVSGEIGVHKASGNLFHHLLQAEDLTPADVVHTGDNPLGDDAAPAALGIAVEPLGTGVANRFETEMLAHGQGSRHALARLAGLARAERVSRVPGDGWLADAGAVAADVVAPLFCAFTAWVLRTARDEGIERLYFVSRDTQVLLRAAEALRREGDPSITYLYGSRQAWFLAGVDAVDPVSLHWVLEPEWSLKTPAALLAKLDLRPDELDLTAHGLTPETRLDAAGLERFWALLDAESDTVLGRAAEARTRLFRYLEQEGLTGPGRWALVDIGWRLTAQRALRQVLTHAGLEGEMLGLYFGLARKRAPLHATGDARAFVLEDDELVTGYLPEDWVLGNTSFIEQVFAMADHGSCTGYEERDGGVVPTLRELAADPDRDAYQPLLHDTVAGFAEAAAADGLLDDHLETVRAAGLLVGRMAVEQPDRDQAAALGRLRVGDDQNETRMRELAGPLLPRDVVRRAASKAGLPVTRDFETDHLWNEGSLALTSPVVRRAFLSLKAARTLAGRGRRAARRTAPVRRARQLTRRRSR
jgi:FMN phosphatase YigB (HAD superfamily)